MALGKRRWSGQSSWRDWLWSALLGIGLALVLILWTGWARNTEDPEREPVFPLGEPEETGRSLGLEFNFRFRILLPEDKDK